MAGLPPDGEWIVQQADGVVVVMNRYSEEEIVSFDPSNGDESARAQRTIHESTDLSDEQKCFAHFWSGYFYAHARMH